MRRKLIGLGLGLVALLAFGACGTSNTGSASDNAFVRVTEDEWHVKPSMPSVPAGKVSFAVVNQGKLPHELVILRTDRAPNALVVPPGADKIDEAATGDNVGEIEVEPGVTEAGTFQLAAGHYVLVCNIVSHYKQGMYAAFDVKASVAKPNTSAAPAVREGAKTTKAAEAPGVRKDIALMGVVRPLIVKTLDAAQKGDRKAASTALHVYDVEWHGVEVYVAFRSPKLYGDLETDIFGRLAKLLDDSQSSQATIVSTTQELLTKWDEIMVAMNAAPAISPLFEDLAALRTLKAETINDANTAVKAGDIATAKPLITAFINRWPDVEDMVKSRNGDIYTEIEGAIGKVNAAVQKTNVTAAELAPLVDTLLNRFNYAQALVNAAARGSDVSKTTYTKDDVQAAATLAAIAAQLNASQPANGQLLANVAPVLKAKNGADAPLQKALDAFAPLANKSGDATAKAAQKTALEAVGVAQQWIVGQFWGDAKLQDAIKAAMPR